MNNSTQLFGSDSNPLNITGGNVRSLRDHENTREWLTNEVTKNVLSTTIDYDSLTHRVDFLAASKLVSRKQTCLIEEVFGLVASHNMTEEPINNGFRLVFLYHVDCTNAASRPIIPDLPGTSINIMNVERIVEPKSVHSVGIMVEKSVYDEHAANMGILPGSNLRTTEDRQSVGLGPNPLDKKTLFLARDRFKSFLSGIHIRTNAAAKSLTRGGNTSLLFSILQQSPSVYMLPRDITIPNVTDRNEVAMQMNAVVPQLMFALNKIRPTNPERATQSQVLTDLMTYFENNTNNSASLGYTHGYLSGDRAPFSKPNCIMLITPLIRSRLFRAGVLKTSNCTMNQVMTVLSLAQEDMHSMHTCAPDKSVSLVSGFYKRDENHQMMRHLQVTPDTPIDHMTVDGKGVVAVTINDDIFSESINRDTKMTAMTTFDFMMPVGALLTENGRVNPGPSQQRVNFANEKGTVYTVTCDVIKPFLQKLFTDEFKRFMESPSDSALVEECMLFYTAREVPADKTMEELMLEEDGGGGRFSGNNEDGVCEVVEDRGAGGVFDMEYGQGSTADNSNADDSESVKSVKIKKRRRDTSNSRGGKKRSKRTRTVLVRNEYMRDNVFYTDDIHAHNIISLALNLSSELVANFRKDHVSFINDATGDLHLPAPKENRSYPRPFAPPYERNLNETSDTINKELVLAIVNQYMEGTRKINHDPNLYEALHRALYNLTNLDAVAYLKFINPGFSLILIKPTFVQSDSMVLCQPSGFTHLSGAPQMKRTRDTSDAGENVCFMATAHTATGRLSLGSYPSVTVRNAAVVNWNCTMTDSVLDVTDKDATRNAILWNQSMRMSGVENATFNPAMYAGPGNCWWPLFAQPIINKVLFEGANPPVGRFATQYRNAAEFGAKFTDRTIHDIKFPSVLSLNKTFSLPHTNINTLLLYDKTLWKMEPECPLFKYLNFNDLAAKAVNSLEDMNTRHTNKANNMMRSDNDDAQPPGVDETNISNLLGAAFPKTCWTDSSGGEILVAREDLRTSPSYRLNSVITTNCDTGFFVTGHDGLEKFDRLSANHKSFTF